MTSTLRDAIPYCHNLASLLYELDTEYRFHGTRRDFPVFATKLAPHTIARPATVQILDNVSQDVICGVECPLTEQVLDVLRAAQIQLIDPEAHHADFRLWAEAEAAELSSKGPTPYD